MLKNAKYRYISPARRTPLPFGHLPLKGAKLGVKMMALLVLLLWGVAAQAQGYFTLTNGRLWWSNGTVDQPDNDWKDPIAFDEANSWAEVHPHGTDHVTHITAQGDTYLALDTTTSNDYPNGKIVTKSTSNQFDLFCVWYRTGYTGYYYQEHYDETASKTYRYYIIANSDADSLEIVRVEVGQPLEKSTYWYNWDFGAAAWETPKINGETQNRYYWMMLQDRSRTDASSITPVWKLSHHTYQRPEDIYYDDYTRYGSDPLHKHYYDEVDGVNEYYPTGNGALYLPVTVKAHEDSIVSIAPNGLQRLTMRIDLMEYGTDDTNTVMADITYNGSGKVPMTVRPAYTEYVEETYRRGINLNYRYRNEEGVFNSAGIGTSRQHNYWGGTDHGDAIPSNVTVDTTKVDTIIFAVDNRSRRYLKVDTIYPMDHATKKGQAVLKFFAPCSGTHTAEVYVTVRYNNGAVQRDTTTLTLHFEKTARNIGKPTVGPVVRGAVFGGGRMANVGGGTEIYIHSTDSIKTLYGGNDIAGWVQGSIGANLVIGTEFTSEDHPVRIGNVYGGGNGYYTYQGINSGFNEATGEHLNPYFWKKSTALGYQAYYFNGKVYPWNTLPSGYMDNASEADRMNKDQSAWDTLTPVTTHEFVYTPFYIGRPDLVDQAETGDDGDGTIPYIKTAHITVGVPEGSSTPFVCDHGSDSVHWYNDHIMIDTLFGGARNAFIGVTANEGESPENGVTIDINGGTMYAVFGGNNVGGAVANTSTVFVEVHDTKLLPSDGVVEETFLTGYGRDFGIRYLFGGGNKVDGSHANVEIFGGMIDTAYLGGNSATVQNPIGTIDCRKQGSTNGFGYDGHFICTNTTYPDPYTFTDPVAELDANEHLFDRYGPDNFYPEEGLYNLRCLFGGNNSADMANLTTIQLHSGGISSVYGGGNVGDMVNDQTYNVTDAISYPNNPLDGTHYGNGENQPFPNPLYNYLFNTAFDIDADGNNIPGGWADVYGRLTLPQKVGTIVTALPNSKIVCDYVFGGARIGNIKNAAGVYLAGGIYGYVTGGNDVSGDVGSETGSGVYLILDQNALVVGDAVGGSDGYYHCDDGTGHYGDGELYDTYANDEDAIAYDPYNEFTGKLLPTHNNVNFYMRGGLVLGQVVAGGVHADVGFDQRDHNWIHKLSNGTRQDVDIDLSAVGGELRGTVHFMANGGHVLGNGFGGGFQSKVHGLSYLTISGDARIDGSFFCGNDCTGSIRSFGTYMNSNDYQRHIQYAHNAADSLKALDSTYADMVSSDSTALNSKDQYGNWNAATSAYLRIKDTPYVHCVYGSGNGAYDYDSTRPQYSKISYCDDGSGSITPLQSSTFIDINTSGVNPKVGDGIDTVFGGGNGVGVEEKVVVLLNNTASDVHAVHTIFGGNNVDDMYDVVPEIRLLKGKVNTVYAGANNGVMGAKKSSDFKDVFGNAVAEVSTHVQLNSEDVTIIDTLFGGSRMSNIEGNTFVEVMKTNTDGVNYIFGGNDISGTITGTTRIDVSGGTVHNIFGGSDGRYDFVEVGDNEFNVFPFGFYDAHPTLFDGHAFDHADSVAYFGAYITTAGYPEIDSTNINIWGGTVGTDTGGVYGGGSMADCRATCVVVNDTVEGTNGQATIYGTVFGGGMGDYADLNNRNLRGERYGNVDEATHVDLYHAKLLSSAKAYGGGRGGDVMNTYITTHEGWSSQLDSLFGGGWGADVHGTTHVIINGKEPTSGTYNVAHLFGGNDFAGDVYKADVTVNSGHFNYIYGAGNGDYADSRYNSGTYADNPPVYNHIHRPNVEYVKLTFNDGVVDGNLYGGGKRGSTWAYQKDANRQYVLGDHGHKVPDTALTTAQAHSDPKDYAYVITNIHGGKFKGNIYGGARGVKGADSILVYGLKTVNMDAGKVAVSVYGGSESVHDGYPAECKSSSTTTKRPSSIVNVTGGTIENNIYGGGYLGITYGSAYLNIGTDAIDSCVAYKQRYGSSGAKSTTDSVYWQFKPGEEGSLVEALGKDELLLNRSVYVGSNWGNAGGSSDFTKPGFSGGESKIIIDGKDYNTDNDELNSNPQMNISKSVFCAGTSVSGGDVNNSKDIDIWNYGSIVNCQPTRKLESVQRSDFLMFHNSAIELTGAIDATSAYQSIPYSLNNVSELDYRGYNVIQYDAKVTNLYTMSFYDEDMNNSGNPVETDLEYLNAQAQFNQVPHACDAEATICDKIDIVNPDDPNRQYTLMIINNGVDFTVGQDDEGTINYGGVKGFGYIATPPEYSSSIYAHRYSEIYESTGGFVSPCKDTNQWTDIEADEDEVGEDWVKYEDCDDDQLEKIQYPFTNLKDEHNNDYRVWKVGKGIRRVETTILAHAVPDSLKQDVHFRTKVNSKMAVAEAYATLPATSEGHYYRLISGITLSSENETLNLIDSAFMPSKTFGYLDTLYDGGGFIDTSVTDRQGKILGTSLDNLGVATGLQDIVDHPTNTFGLVMVPGEYFQGVPNGYFKVSDTNDFVMPRVKNSQEQWYDAPQDSSLFIFTGNSHVTSFEHYITPKVASGTALTPTMNFYLTYNTDFSTALLGTAEFTLMEYDAAGNEVAPIEVKVYISTIIEEFKPITTNVLAMYNAGRTNTFTRKVVLPATLEENRQLYLESVKWLPTTINGEDAEDSTRFYLVKNEAAVTGAAALVNNLFALNVIPSEDLTSEMASNLGWSTINQPNINVYDLKTNPSHTTAVRYSDSTGAKAPKAIDLTEDDSKGLLIGTLDGRGTAVLNMQLTFDGERRYPATKGKGYVGKVVFNMASRLNDGSPKRFPITVYVKTRDEADTIYIASAASVTRGGYTVNPYTANSEYTDAMTNPGSTQIQKDAALAKVGKSPDWYVRTFQEALSTKVYQEGDVLCILDTVKVNQGLGLAIHGGDGPAIQVIRYEGHHHELPGEVSVYRYGPMIQVSKNGSSFTATNIAFHGGAGALIKNDPAVDVKVPDTNCVFAPIFQVLDSGALVLHESTSVQHNWNAYGALSGQLDDNGLPKNARDMGAISLTNNGSLTLRGNVDISQNLSHTYVGDRPGNPSYDVNHPFNGAVYVDGGRVILPESKESTAITLTENWLVNPQIHELSNNVCWWDTVTIGGNPVRWAFDTSKVADWQKANVFLTRKAATTGNTVMHDSQSDMIVLTGAVSEDSRIGVRKWFPGPTERDTIRIATAGGSNLAVLSRAVEDSVFVSDDDERVFYSALVNNNYVYLFRCATFRHQKNDVDLPLAKANGTHYKGDDVLAYLVMPGNHCPVGGDSILYRVQGGFAPYTFTWSGDVSREYTKPYSNAQITNALATGDSSLYWASITDTFVTTYVETVLHSPHTLTANVHVKAVDATGECELSKDIIVNAHMVRDRGEHQLWEPVTSPDNGWTDTASVVTGNRKKAVGDRYLEGITITPYVYADPSAGYIVAAHYDNEGKHLYRYIDEEHRHELDTVLFCGGEDIRLKTGPNSSSHEFIMWNFDPYTDNPATYVVPAHSDNVVAYYAPKTHWNDTITSMERGGAVYTSTYYYGGRPSVPTYNLATGDGTTTSSVAGYVTTLNGDVHIYNENGLAWFISVVNGLNGTQARQFRFNNVYLHQKDGGYDMKNFLWTPTGTQHQPFRGCFLGVGSDATATTALTGDEKVIIKNIIINEPEMPYTGFFGHLDTALVKSIKIESALIRGSQYVGALAASSKRTYVENVSVADGSISNTTILTTHYTSGGLIGLSSHDTLINFSTQAMYVGDAVYSGGAVGYGTSTIIENSQTRNDNSMSGLYIGGIAGYLDGTAPRKGGLFRRKSAGEPSVVKNNYVRLENNKGLRVGGLVGYAKNSVLENNYFYGNVAAVNSGSGVASILEGGSADGNFYQLGAAEKAVTTTREGAVLENTTTFAGKGNQVMLADRVHGRNNLTRVLNAWVREQNERGGNYKSWRSDLLGENENFPLFGEPDLIPVNATETFEGCEEVIVDGFVYTSDTVISSHVVDSIEMIDSTVTATIRLHYGTETYLSDSASLEEGYYDNGFSLSSTDLQSLEMTQDSAGHSILILHDTLSTTFGCDSVVTLTLVFANSDGPIEEETTTVNAYPNPTISVVHVEAEGMSHVEVYDNEGRKLQDYDAFGKSKVTVDMRPYASGVYFIRVYMPHEVVIQKIIKQR